jgi:hypothetical protein
MEEPANGTSETLVDIQLRTRQYIPEDSELHTRHHENLKSQVVKVIKRDKVVSRSDHKCQNLKHIQSLYWWLQ